MKDAKQELNGVKAVVFDLDGTLYDKHGLARRLVRRLWWCLPLIIIDRVARGACWRWIVRTRWHRHVYLATMVDLIAQTCPRREEVVELAQESRARGLKTAIWSDYGCIREKLVVLHIDAKLFDLLVSAPELGARKPSEQAAREVLSRLDAAPQETLFVGDRDDNDGASARAVGAKFLLIQQ